MNWAYFSNIFLVISACSFLSASALEIPSHFRDVADETECTKEIIKIISAEQHGHIGDFRGKSELEQTKALWEELKVMLKNGNNYTQNFEKGLAYHTATNGGEAYEIKELDDFVKNATTEAKINQLTSCKLAKIFPFVYHKMKESVSNGRLGASETFLPMIREIITNIDPEKTIFIDSPVAIAALSSLIIGAIPDFGLSILTLVTYIPEPILERFLEDFPKALKTFNRSEYAMALQLLQ